LEPQALVQSWLRGRAGVAPDGRLRLAAREAPRLAEKFRLAYHWIADQALHAPYRDLEFGTPSVLGRDEARVELRRGVGYASFILLPLLTLMTSRRLLIIGGPGRGKTTIATLMALLAGDDLDEVRRSIQHGHPQLTIADLLGSPLPGDLVRAREAEEIRVSWRRWITLRVKIIDEYNRIPTKTQSALLSLMAEGYAEMYEQVVRSGTSAWFLTANDDLGGGTFPVIEALKDRIDLVVRCTPFHAAGLDTLVDRIASASSPESFVPADLVFTPAELDAADREARAVGVPREVRDVLGFLLGQLDFCRRASDRLDYQNKDTLRLAGRRVGHVCTEDCPLDKQTNLCAQTEGGVSARAYQALVHLAQALAYFRGHPEVEVDDLRALLPWVLHEKLQPNALGAFFLKAENQVYLTDRVSWIHQLFDAALAQYAAYRPAREPILELKREADSGLDGLGVAEVRARLDRARRQVEVLLRTNELNGPVHADLILLKGLHDRYRDRLEQLERAGRAPGGPR
jgi:MoxR-like ATPase